MDKTDMDILAALKANARATLSEISKNVCLSIPAVAFRIKRLEQSGIIEKYTIQIDRKNAGYHLLAFILVTITTPDKAGTFREYIAKAPNVLECHHITGENDYLLKVLFESMNDLEIFLTDGLKKTGCVEKSNTIISLSTLKDEINV